MNFTWKLAQVLEDLGLQELESAEVNWVTTVVVEPKKKVELLEKIDGNPRYRGKAGLSDNEVAIILENVEHRDGEFMADLVLTLSGAGENIDTVKVEEVNYRVFTSSGNIPALTFGEVMRTISLDKEKRVREIEERELAERGAVVLEKSPDVVVEPVKRVNHLFDMGKPVYLMAAPQYVSNANLNNVWMKKEDSIDVETAVAQWMGLYQTLAFGGMVYLLPPQRGLQDLVYTANIGIVLPPHIRENTFVLSKFKSEPRVGEELIGSTFATNLGFDVIQAPAFFEGEAEMKFLGGKTFVCGIGQRSAPEAFKWMEKEFGIKAILVETTPELYHLDCMIFPIDTENVMMCTSYMDKKVVAEIAKVINVIDVPKDLALEGVTNCVRTYNTVLCSSPIHALPETDERYEIECDKIDWMEKTLGDLGYETVFINLMELEKSGALLSCCVCHLNYHTRLGI